MAADLYPRLTSLIQAYFNQDSDLIADTLDGLLDAYVKASHAAERSELRHELAAFRRDHAARLDAAFIAAYGFDIHPADWGHDAASFFDAIDARMRA